MDTLDAVIEGGGHTGGPSYFEALTAFLERLNAASAESYARNYPHMKPPTYMVAGRGRKYDKIACLQWGSGSLGGAFCFVEKETGLIWKPANARAPVRNFPRGDIFALPERLEKAKEDPILHIPAARW